MLNEIATSSALEGVDKTELSIRIVKNSEQLIEDYVLWHKCGWSDEEFGSLLGISAKTVKNRYLADARKQGLIEAGKRGQASPVYARDRAKPVENSTPTYVTPVTTETHSPNYDLRTEPVLGTLTLVADEDEFRNPRCDDADAERDYDECLAHIDAILALTHKYFKSGWSYGKWNELDGECKLIRECCETRKRFIDRQESERCSPGEVVDTTCTA